MRFITVFGILALAVAASEGSIFSRFYMSSGPVTTKATTTTARPTTTTARPTTTTARPTTTMTTTTTSRAPQAAAQSAPGQLPPNAIDNVLGLFDIYTQLQGKEDQVFSPIPNNGPDPFSATIGSLPQEVQNVAKCLYDLVKAHPAGTPWDLSVEMTCAVAVPAVTG